jgi:hypothetical protein
MCDYNSNYEISDEEYEIMMSWNWNDHEDEDYEDCEFDYDNGFDMADEI